MKYSDITSAVAESNNYQTLSKLAKEAAQSLKATTLIVRKKCNTGWCLYGSPELADWLHRKGSISEVEQTKEEAETHYPSYDFEEELDYPEDPEEVERSMRDSEKDHFWEGKRTILDDLSSDIDDHYRSEEEGWLYED